MWCAFFLQCSEIESDCFEIFQSQFGNPPISAFKFLSCSACWSKKQDAGMLTSNAKSSSPTLSHALQQVKAARIEVICQGVSSAPHFLFAKAPRVQLSTYSPISLSRIHLADSLYQCPADCFKDILLEQAGNSHWNKLAFLQHIKWHICSVGAWKYFTWYQWGQWNAD